MATEVGGGAALTKSHNFDQKVTVLTQAATAVGLSLTVGGSRGFPVLDLTRHKSPASSQNSPLKFGLKEGGRSVHLVAVGNFLSNRERKYYGCCL